MERGVINNPAHAKQMLLFDGCVLTGTNITPTDIDAYIEYHGKTTIMIEVKHRGVDVGEGQQKLMKQFIEDGLKAGKRNLVIVADHDIEPGQDVHLKTDCFVRGIYIPTGKNSWTKRQPSEPNLPVWDCVTRWIDYINRPEPEEER